jgi:hypothetical protein
MPDKAHAAAVGREVRLGKLEVKPDQRNLQLARYVDEQKLLPQVPAQADWSQKVGAWPMYANDQLGDCTCAAVGHMEEAWSANAGGPEVPSEQDVLALYWATGSADTGRYCLDVLNYWQSKGFGGEAILAFTQINPKRREHVELACWMFGGVYIGLELPISAKGQKDEWTLTEGPEAAPRSWGGHCVNVVDYRQDSGPTCVTWGRLMPMSWDFFEGYCDEAYAVISPDFLNAQQETPSGFNLDELKRDLREIDKASAPAGG